MRNKSISKTLLAVTPMMIVCVVLALGASGMAQSRDMARSGHRSSRRDISTHRRFLDPDIKFFAGRRTPVYRDSLFRGRWRLYRNRSE